MTPERTSVRPPPCRAEHVGSLLRPPALLQAHLAHHAGTLSSSELDALVEGSIADVVRFQQMLGFKALSDGEYGRYMFYDGFFDGLEGMVRVEPRPELFQDWLPHYARYKAGTHPWVPVKTYQAQAKLGTSTHHYVKWFERVKRYVPQKDWRFIKMTMISPEWYHFTMGSNAYTKDAYANDEEYLSAVASAYRGELLALYAAGCRNVQIDAPLLAAFCSTHTREALQRSGVDPDSQLETYVDMYNECLKGREEEMSEMRVGMHLCRGNSQGMHFYEGGYEAIATRLFGKLDVDCFYLEFDNPRSGNLAPLRHLPVPKVAILGLISSKTPVLESKEEIKALLDEAAILLGGEEGKEKGKDRLGLSPQCGFASRVEGNPVEWGDMENKLMLVSEIAQEMWGTMV